MANKPVVGISSCLLGQPVRYDGGHKQQSAIVNYLSEAVDLYSFCPEVSAGLGTPRPPVELVQIGSNIIARGRDDHSLDVTAELSQVAQQLVQQLKQQNAVAYIFKARSPSCGIGTTPLFNEDKQLLTHRDGLIAEQINKHLPNLIIVDESTVTNKQQCENFLACCELAALRHSESVETGWWQQRLEEQLGDAINTPNFSTPINDKTWQLLLQKFLYPLLLAK